jgi:hypothetical protein
MFSLLLLGDDIPACFHHDVKVSCRAIIRPDPTDLRNESRVRMPSIIAFWSRRSTSLVRAGSSRIESSR